MRIDDRAPHLPQLDRAEVPKATPIDARESGSRLASPRSPASSTPRVDAPSPPTSQTPLKAAERALLDSLTRTRVEAAVREQKYPTTPDVPENLSVPMDGRKGGAGRIQSTLDLAAAVLDATGAVSQTSEQAGGEPSGAILGDHDGWPTWVRAIDAHLTRQAQTGGGITDIVEPIAEAVIEGRERDVLDVVGEVASDMATAFFEDLAGGPVLFLASVGMSTPDLWVPQPGGGPLGPSQGDGTEDGEEDRRGQRGPRRESPANGSLLPAEDDTPEFYHPDGPWRPRGPARDNDSSSAHSEKGGPEPDPGTRGHRTDRPAGTPDTPDTPDTPPPTPNDSGEPNNEPDKPGKDPKKSTGLPPASENGGSERNDDVRPRIPEGSPDRRSGLEQLREPSVRLFATSTGPADEGEPRTGGAHGDVPSDPSESRADDLGPGGLSRGPAPIQVGPFAPKLRLVDPGDPIEGF